MLKIGIVGCGLQAATIAGYLSVYNDEYEVVAVADFNPEKFSSIGTKLAKSSGYPILPFALKTDFLQNGKYLRDMGPIKRDEDVWFEFPPARPVTGNGREQQQEVIDFIVDRLAKWRNQKA